MAGQSTDKREAIMQAALELFAERGFHGTAVPQVAERAGVGAGTIYRYFENKEALVNSLYQRWKLRMGEALTECIVPGQPARQQFHVVWRRLARFAEEDGTALRFMELHHHGPYIDDESRRCELLVHGAAKAFFEQTEREQITKNVSADLLVAIVYGAFSGLIKSAWSGHLELDEQTLDASERCVWEAIRR